MNRRVRGRAAFGAVALAVLAGAAASAGPASAAPPFPPGANATAIVGGSVVADCPPGSFGAVSGGNSTVGAGTVTGAGARCSTSAAAADGLYTIAGAATGILRFSADCESTTGKTGGGVDVPAGTNVPGLGVVASTTTVTSPVTVTYPNGSTAQLNQVVTTPTSVTRTAIIHSSGAVIGRVVCGQAAYPLAVDVAGAAEAVADSVAPSNVVNTAGGRLTMLAAVALAVAGLLHLGLARRVRRHTS